MRRLLGVTAVAIGLELAYGPAGMAVAVAEPVRAVAERQVRRVLRQAFAKAPADWERRLIPDATMATCAEWRNQPPKAVADAIKAREATRISYPDDANFLGDWQRGEAIAQSGYGLRFTDTDAKRENGGNCYACHQLGPDEVSYGTLGVSLKGYGRIHELGSDAPRLVYEKIFNSQAVVPCSLMPRFGVNGILTIEQIKDLVALLMHPDSPVNRLDAPKPKDAARTGTDATTGQK